MGNESYKWEIKDTPKSVIDVIKLANVALKELINKEEEPKV